MRALLSLGAAIACTTLLCGCESIPGFSRAGRLLRQPASVVLPSVEAQPSSDLPPPPNVRASGGELRAVPLKWEPLLAGDVDGYVVERASAREGPYERVAVVPGRPSTVWIDEDAAPAAGDDGEVPPVDGATWYYRVRSFDPEGRLSTGASTIATATTAYPMPPYSSR